MHLAKYAADSALFDFDCTNLLASGETIDPEVPIVMSALPDYGAESDATLVFGEPVVNTVPITYPDGRVMEIGKGFQVRIEKGQASDATQYRTYAVTGFFSTSEDNQLTTKARLLLLPLGYPAP